METSAGFVYSYDVSYAFNFLASLINGNLKGSAKIEARTNAFNFLASLINGNILVGLQTQRFHLGSFNFLASLINGNLFSASDFRHSSASLLTS